MTIVTSLLAQLSNAMTSIFLLFLTVVFMLLEVPSCRQSCSRSWSVRLKEWGDSTRAGQRLPLSGAENRH
jgi:predicted PurR-regulated permease PerM